MPFIVKQNQKAFLSKEKGLERYTQLILLNIYFNIIKLYEYIIKLKNNYFE